MKRKTSKTNAAKKLLAVPAITTALTFASPALGNGQFDGWKNIGSAVALGLSAVLPISCKPATDAPTTQTVTKNVSVDAVPFSADTSLDFTPIFTPDGGWGDNFQASDITWTLTDDAGATHVIKTNGDSDGIVSGGSYADEIQTFTQVFKYNGTEIGRRAIYVGMCTGIFGVLLTDVNGSPLDPQQIPAVALSPLSKQVPVR
jgi:hypothetical protein